MAAASPGSRFRAFERLRVGADFQRVFRRGVRLDGAQFLLVAAPNGRPHARLGLAASRKVGGAVARNRAKRLLREAFRLNKSLAPSGLDLVLVAKPGLAERSQREVNREYCERLRRLATRSAAGLGRSGPAASA